MAQVVSMSIKWFTDLKPAAMQTGKWLLSLVFVAFITALVTAYVTSSFTRRDNLELAFKQQQLTDIQRFQTSAGELDSAFRAFNDALVDNEEVAPARDAMREAITKHSSDTFALQRLFGSKGATAYIAQLAKLRQQIDQASSPETAMSMAQSTLDIIAERQRMIRRAEQKIGYQA